MKSPGNGMLTTSDLSSAAEALGRRDPDLRRVVARWGVPPMWGREPGFATLVHLILEQQVSLASAAAAMDRLTATIGAPRPAVLLALDDDEMRRIGFSRQKRRYARDLARRIEDNRLDVEGLGEFDDSEVRARLMEVTGIGAWTADIYLLMALRRPDVWPVGDRALVVAARTLKGLETDPDPDRLTALAAAWRPWRSVAARILWHFYLSEIRPPGGRARGPARAT